MSGTRKRPGSGWKRALVTAVSCLVLGAGLAIVPAGSAHPGADKQQSSSHGDCKNPGSKGDTHNTTGNHNGYDCPSTGVGGQPGSEDNDADDQPGANDNDDQPGSEDNDADDQPGAIDNDDQAGTEDNDADDQPGAIDNDDQTGTEDNDADDQPGFGPNGANGLNGANGANGTTLTVTPTKSGVIVLGSHTKRNACASRRAFTIRIAKQHGGVTLKSATVSINGRVLRAVKGRRLTAPIVLRKLPRGTFTVRIRAVTTTGRVLRGKRVYHTCIPRLHSKHPPKL